MYTRHMSIPKNYNGVRFSREDDGIAVKEHRPAYRDGVKSSHSPLYRREETEEKESSPPEITDTLPSVLQNEPVITETDGNDSEAEILPTECEASRCDNGQCRSPSPFSSIDIKRILDGINREDALLIGLILLIASEGNSDNNLILTALALLLLF